MSDSKFTPRSVLFVPGHRPDMLAKVGRSGPDAVVIDLEDAVSPPAKDEARATVMDGLARERPAAGTVLVRVNGAGTQWHDADVAACATAIGAGQLDGVVLPVYERVDDLTRLRSALPAGAVVVVGLESALGVADARPLLAEGPDAAYFGAEDFIADLGGRRTPGGAEVQYARSQVCLAARLGAVTALDQVIVAVHDAEAFRAEAEQAVALGYRGKLCLHPIQVAVAHEVFTPSAEQIEHARAVLAAAESGVGLVDGQMVDAVHVTMARAVLERAGV
ncbi:HpcH/HpaI aldolase/citrate lyase family protein [Pseudonocardia spinosispora]|uniref:HpcH/HpaI aldolase/citrate lyase family protein n=1 Tax=Pseudonocardia spinosispora TaxID=103441 RepID=UPI0004260670|nr:CoA ester lyase [Pseudonocardia spinosispora]